jgi:hypothetical protein
MLPTTPYFSAYKTRVHLLLKNFFTIGYPKTRIENLIIKVLLSKNQSYDLQNMYIIELGCLSMFIARCIKIKNFTRTTG